MKVNGMKSQTQVSVYQIIINTDSDKKEGNVFALTTDTCESFQPKNYLTSCFMINQRESPQ